MATTSLCWERPLARPLRCCLQLNSRPNLAAPLPVHLKLGNRRRRPTPAVRFAGHSRPREFCVVVDGTRDDWRIGARCRILTDPLASHFPNVFVVDHPVVQTKL